MNPTVVVIGQPRGNKNGSRLADFFSGADGARRLAQVAASLGSCINATTLQTGAHSPFSEATNNAGNAFTQAAKDIANGVWSTSDQHLHERLMVQLQKDANDIRKTCAIVRDPNEPRVVTYKAGDDLMAVTRRLCLGQ